MDYCGAASTSSSGLSKGAVIGLAIGIPVGVVVVAIVIGVVVVMVKKPAHKRDGKKVYASPTSALQVRLGPTLLAAMFDNLNHDVLLPLTEHEKDLDIFH